MPERDSPVTRSAAIAVLVRRGKLLVIRRSQAVRAPGKYCFPGGEVECGEHCAEAVVRELVEELGVVVLPVRVLWNSMAPSGCELNWIHVRLTGADFEPRPNQDEVESWQWMTPDELASHVDVLPSNLDFLSAWRAGEFDLPMETGD